MRAEQRREQEAIRVKRMGWVLLGLGLVVTGAAYFLPTNEANYWLSSNGKEGFYVLSLLFGFLGLYCLESTWRR